MNAHPPPPLTPRDCDLRAFRDMPLDIGRFRDSGLVTHEDPEAIIAALHLWGVAWHQVPAASLPDDNRELARFAGYGRAIEAWLRVRDGALRGFVKCSDGRLYHRTLAEKANRAWDSRLAYEYAKAKDRHRKAQKDLPEDQRADFPGFDEWKTGETAAKAAPHPQGDLPLESHGNSSGNPPVRAHTDSHGARAPARRTGAKTVPDENSSGNDEEFQRNGTPIPPEIALKGREGNIRKKDSSHPDSEHDPPERARTRGPFEDGDLKNLVDAVCEAAGHHPVSPVQIDRAYRIVQEWRDEGLDFEGVVVPTIKAAVSESSEPTRTLGRFSARVRHEQARLKAKGEAGRSYRPPASPVLQRQDEEFIFADLRRDLLDRIGPTSFCAFVNPVRFATDEAGNGDPVLRVAGAGGISDRLLDGDLAPAVCAIAAQHGFKAVWKG